MRIVFVAEYDVPEAEVERKVNEVGAALELPTDPAERQGLTVCIGGTANAVVAAACGSPDRGGGTMSAEIRVSVSGLPEMTLYSIRREAERRAVAAVEAYMVEHQAMKDRLAPFHEQIERQQDEIRRLQDQLAAPTGGEG